jgi:hypothetical protein
MLDNLTINSCFNKLIFKIILDEEVKLDDLVFIDKSVNLSFLNYFLVISFIEGIKEGE